MKNEYLAKFDENGRRETSIPRILADDYGGEEKLMTEGYIVISEDDYHHYVGNCGTGDHGTGYIRDSKTGKPISAAAIVVTVQEVATQKWNEVKIARDTAEQAGCPYMNSVLDSDNISVQRISIAVQAAQQAVAAGAKDFTLDWTMQDNSVIAMTAEQVIGMSAALAVYSNQLHEKARQIRETIEKIVSEYDAKILSDEDARFELKNIKFEA